MTGRLESKIAVITDGSSGMGRATVLRFVDDALNEGCVRREPAP